MAAAQVLASSNSLGEIEFLAAALYMLNESNTGSLQPRNNSNATRMNKYNGMNGEVFHEAGQFGEEGDSCNTQERFYIIAKRTLSPVQVSAALALLQPTFSSIMQKHAGISYEVCRAPLMV